MIWVNHQKNLVETLQYNKFFCYNGVSAPLTLYDLCSHKQRCIKSQK